jgi:hypothetical protein
MLPGFTSVGFGTGAAVCARAAIADAVNTTIANVFNMALIIS